MTNPPRVDNGRRVLRYAGDPRASWEAEAEGVVPFEGSVIALAICDDPEDPESCDDPESGGIMAYYLYETGWVADVWYETLEDALEATADDDTVATLTWAAPY